MEKRGGGWKLTIVLCEARGGGGATPYTCYAGMLKKFVVSLF